MNKIHKIKSLLVANRGEIACRIIKTAKRLGLKAIAIYTDLDANALHCQLADEAYYVGPLPLEKSYLNIHNIIYVAKNAKADAIHPGYGFLSENADFAKHCQNENIIFIGPNPDAIAKMAVKDLAKKIMAQAGVPVVPGYHGKSTECDLETAAKRIGYPIILKAAFGGGGKGMRIVNNASELQDAILSAKRESLNAFGNESLFLEKYIQNARHIEVQIFRDKYGNCVHLFERDCSLQRRHQKIIEEAPALLIPDTIKTTLYQAAINAANAINYLGAGTIEFLYQNNKFYFMEMNTRLQVEHPVTEMITHLDLVEWQIKIAEGESLPLTQDEIRCHGHAIEARIYAEDPYHHFLPTTGLIKKIFYPIGNCRIDSGIQTKDKISIYFDPLLAKIITRGTSRQEAVATLQAALDNYHVVGVTTNLPFLRTILRQPEFQQNKIHTQTVSDQLNQLNLDTKPISTEMISIACLIYLLTRERKARTQQDEFSDIYSPWNRTNAWRLNLPFEEFIRMQYQKNSIELQIRHPKTKWDYYHIYCQELELDHIINGKIINDKCYYHFHSHQGTLDFYEENDIVELFNEGCAYYFLINPQKVMAQSELISDQHLIAPMPGIITQIWVKTGERVKAGTKLLALEAMKMEHTLVAAKDGIIKAIFYGIGDTIEEGNELIDFENNSA